VVLAQATPAENAAAAPAVEEVVVTGSRLLQAPNDISISPITSIGAADIAKTGMVRVEDVLNMLPQVTTEQSSGNSISSIGTATVSLRDLGSQRTLVLINGRRMQPGGSGGVPSAGSSANSADINQIPAELIERADVLTGGASAVYGADAVAGVVNFVLNTHYQGVKMDAGYSWNHHENNDQTYLGYLSDFGAPLPPSSVNTGQNRNLSVLIGSNFADGKGNATVYTTYLNSSPSVGYQFDHAGCTLIGGATAHSPITCGGSSTGPHGRFLYLGLNKKGTSSTALGDYAIDPKTGQLRGFQRPGDLYNYGALSYFQRAAERWTAGGFLTYDVNSHVSVYSETMYARNTSTAQYGPSGAFVFEVKPILHCNNPLFTAQIVSTLCTPANLTANQQLFGLPLDTDPATATFEMWMGRRNVEGGPRLDNYLSASIRQVLGAKGEINDAWTYDVYGQFGITDFQDREGNFLGYPQIAAAMDAVPNPQKAGAAPGTGVVPGVPVGGAVCAGRLNAVNVSPLTSIVSNCVPWNVWVPGYYQPGAPGSPPTVAQQLAYLTVPSTYISNATEYIANGSVTGDLGKYGVKLPTATNGMSINIGTEYREEKFNFAPDFIFSNGYQAGGAPSKPIDGRFHVWEGFTEMRLPLINDAPGAYLLSLDGGYRYSSYTEGFNTNTYKIGLEWAPIKDVRLRGGYNRAVRAPNINELFSPAAVGAGGTADPCWGPIDPKTGLVGSGYTQAQCELTGVAANRYGHLLVNPAAQINTQQGGNTALTPEIADTYTVGLVFQPTFVQNLVLSLDAFSIKIKETITQLTSNTVLNQCGLYGAQSACALIHRGADGSLWTSTTEYVATLTQNIGSVSTKGVDLLGHYRLDFGPRAGRLDFALNGTYTHDFLTQPVTGGPSYDCKGHWGSTCGPPLPSWRHVFTTDWGTPWWGLDLLARWRYIGSSTVDRSSSNSQLATPYYASTAHIPAYSYLDLAASIPIGANVTARLGVNNLADKNPPLILNGNLSDCPTNNCNDNTWAGTYDALGRFIFFQLSAQF
jgi:outer membrane receptor protein involved in Fe transport